MSNLELYKNNKLIFSNNGNWVYPLFDLEKFIINNNLKAESLFLKDKIAGRAAAHLMNYIGIKKVHIGLISKPALEVFNNNLIEVTYDNLTDLIKCRTESLLESINSSNEAYRILKKRAGLFSGIEIECLNLICGYEKNKVLESSLKIEEGGSYLLLGANGEGKSTFLRTISNLQPKLGGEIIFRKKGLVTSLTNGQVGFLNQNPQVKNMPILVKELMDVTASLLGLKGDEKKYQIDISLRRTGAINFYNKLYNELSGGEKQRVNLARLICQRAGIFLLDEPDANLDIKGRNSLIDLLNDIHYREMPTIILASHNTEFIKALDWNRLMLSNGVINA